MQDLTERRAHNLFIGPEGLRAGWAIFTFLGIFAIALSIFTALAHTLPRSPPIANSAAIGVATRTFFVNEILLVVAVALATWIMSRIEHRPITHYGTAGTQKLTHFFAGLGWGGTFLSFLVLSLKLTGLLVFDCRLLFGPSTLAYGSLWALAFLLVALFEEGLMRGYLQFTLTRGCAALFRLLNTPYTETLGFWTSALILSILFGLGHRSNPGESPLGLLSAALAGLLFCLSLWRTGSLWWAIGFHAAWDWAQSFLYGVADSGTMVQHHLFATHPAGSPLLSGGATGPEGSLFLLPTLSVAAVIVLLTLSPSASHPGDSPTDPTASPDSASLHR